MPTTTDPDSLDELTLRAGADIRSPLLRTLVDLYLQKPSHTAEEAQHFTALTLRLLDDADAATRAAMARRLRDYPSVPAAVVRRLAGERAVRSAPVKRPPARPGTARDAVSPAAPPISAAELSESFFTASAAERRLILINLAYAAPAVAAVAGDAREAARYLETAALAHNQDAFMRGLERWLGVSPALARRIVGDALGEPLVVAGKALDVAPDALQRILLFVNPVVGRSVSRVYDLALLFDTIDTAAAHALVAIWRAADPRPAVHAPAAVTPPDRGNADPRGSRSRQSKRPDQNRLRA